MRAVFGRLPEPLTKTMAQASQPAAGHARLRRRQRAELPLRRRQGSCLGLWRVLPHGIEIPGICIYVLPACCCMVARTAGHEVDLASPGLGVTKALGGPEESDAVTAKAFQGMP